MKRSLLTVMMLVLFAGSIAAQIKIIAHRGFWTTEGSAQNSIASLVKAHEAGAYGAEFDVYYTTDRVSILNHDDSIPGFKIEKSAYADLKNVALPNGEMMPTLETYLQEAVKREGIQLILELKSHSRTLQEDQAANDVVALVQKYGLQGRTEYISFSMNACKELIKKAPGAPVYYLNGNASPQDLKELGFAGLDYNHGVLKNNPEWVKEAHDLGMKVNVWTVNTPEDMQYFIGLGVDFITTDKPLELKAMLGQ